MFLTPLVRHGSFAIVFALIENFLQLCFVPARKVVGVHLTRAVRKCVRPSLQTVICSCLDLYPCVEVWRYVWKHIQIMQINIQLHMKIQWAILMAKMTKIHEHFNVWGHWQDRTVLMGPLTNSKLDLQKIHQLPKSTIINRSPSSQEFWSKIEPQECV